jgi:hypothetical protein
MKKHFYSHLVDTDGLVLELEELDLEEEERKELLHMASMTLHHTVMEVILDALSEEDKQIFLSHMAHDNHDKVWEHLKSRIENIETKIRATADSTMKELYKDIREVKEEDLQT